jgi:hypothetical protein
MQYPEQETDPSIEEAEARRKEHQEQLARVCCSIFMIVLICF